MGETFLIVLFSTRIAVLIAKLAMPYLSHVASVPANMLLISNCHFNFFSWFYLNSCNHSFRYLSRPGYVWL